MTKQKTPKPKTGRSLTLTAELAKQMVDFAAKGVPDVDNCQLARVTPESFYQWIRWGRGIAGEIPEPKNTPKAEQSRALLLQFFQDITRARSESRKAAIDAFRTGLETQEETRTEIETFTEIRLNKNGEPYTYTKTTERTVIIMRPPDWRAGADWLERRARSDWNRKTEITVQNWEQETIRRIAAGEIDYQSFLDIFGDEPLAKRLFSAAGVDIPKTTNE